MNFPAAEILFAICCQFCLTALYYSKKYIRGQDPVVSVPVSLSIALLKVASGRQSSGGMVVRLFYLPYMIKTDPFLSIVEQFV